MVLFSIVIPHEPEREIEVLKSIEKLDYPKDMYEVILKPGTSPSKQRNEGIKEAKGEMIAFVDDDCRVDENWLKETEKEINGFDVLGGPNLTPGDDSFFGKVSGLAIASKFGAFKMADRYRKGRETTNADETQMTSANCFIRKKVFDEIGGFDPRLFPNEESELLVRAKNHGFKFKYSPKVVVYHRRRSNPFAFAKQFFRSGKGRIEQTRISGGLKPVFVLPVFFIMYLTSLMFIREPIFLIPLLAYLVLDIGFSIYEGIMNKNVSAIVLLPFIFPLLHISYGLGTIRGLLVK